MNEHNENSGALFDEDDLELEENVIIELVDEEGNVTRFGVAGIEEVNGTVYYAMIPEDLNDEDEDTVGFVVLKEIEENGEKILATVDDEDEFEKIGLMFEKKFSEGISEMEELLDELEELDG